MPGVFAASCTLCVLNAIYNSDISAVYILYDDQCFHAIDIYPSAPPPPRDIDHNSRIGLALWQKSNVWFFWDAHFQANLRIRICMVGNPCFSQSKNMTTCEKVPCRPKFGGFFFAVQDISRRQILHICAHFFVFFGRVGHCWLSRRPCFTICYFFAYQML